MDTNEFDNFDLVIDVTDETGEIKSLTINSEDLIAYVQVDAAGDTYYADNCQLFGVVIDFGEVVPAIIEVSIMVNGDCWFYANY